MPSNAKDTQSCRVFHLMPRFMHQVGNEGVELLSSSEIMRYLLANKGPLIEELDLGMISNMKENEWNQYIEDMRGTLVTNPARKPSCVRIDQLDREPADNMQLEGVHPYPLLVHITTTPIKFSLFRDPAYKRLARDFFRMQYLLTFKAKGY